MGCAVGDWAFWLWGGVNFLQLAYTSSSNFPVTSSAFQSINRGIPDTFVTQVSPSGGAFWYSSYLGGSAADSAGGIALDSSLNVYVSGRTLSSDFPTTVYGYSGGYDAFITKFTGP
ncbi:SBBP repeat-containing protein [Archangium sp. Cb G35]|uniref:SBBP repeat-containing protein n=1 Tax=Archangium sp. Cb G35 TaxID=1920190 RepID=UPI000936A2FF